MASFRDAVLLPGRAGLLYFGASLWLFHMRVTRVSCLSLGAGQTLVNWPWILCGLPLVGAAAAWRSRRVAGSRAQRIAAAVFPAAAPTLVLAVTTSADLLRGDCGAPIECLQTAGAHWLAWAILPAIALAAGCLPFWGDTRSNLKKDNPGQNLA